MVNGKNGNGKWLMVKSCYGKTEILGMKYASIYEVLDKLYQYLPRYRPHSSSEDRRFKANEGKY